ncbi:uncharacterized protein LOC142984294 [Anticarsia gemmatalis]|uniref:uncharacterized protein LOC142984294 n=1 Tax=Anticarsia gemmatalis TaxID=129554 RepID=UPI003F765A90
MYFFLLLLLPGARLEEATPSSLLSPRNYNHHPFKAVQFLNSIKPTKKGPILFPNDGPPPPPTPLIVTSRPLIESIRRSDLNPNNTIQAQSQVNPVTYRPGFLARLKDYRPYVYNVVTPRYYNVPYAEVAKKRGEDNYDDYEQRTVLPPIYRALSDHANKVLKKQRQKKPIYEYQEKSPDYATYTNDVEDTSKEYDQGENYAFSYRVKDQKTGDDFSHSQRSSGSATNGEYRVRLPDGRMQIVSYTADENGYKADVRYDDHSDNHDHNHNHNHDQNANRNRIDIGSKENQYQNEYIDSRYRVQETDEVYKPIYNDNLKYSRENIYPEYVDKTKPNNGFIPVINNDYLDQYNDKVVNNEPNIYNEKIVPVYDKYKPHQDTDYYHYSDELSSKEYKDYSSENEYQPHRSKYSAFASQNTVTTTAKPTYEQLKNIFVAKLFQQPIASSTINPIEPNPNKNFVLATISPNFETTTENVVIIGAKKPTLFTNIRSMINPVTATPLTYSTPAPLVSTPSSYLYSTIANLKNKINLSNKPVLSNKFIDKINKYLSYK